MFVLGSCLYTADMLSKWSSHKATESFCFVHTTQ